MSAASPSSDRNPDNPRVVAWIESSVAPGAKVLRIEPLVTTTTAKHVIEVRLADGSRARLVLRRYHDAKRRARDPWYVPAHEVAALRLLTGTGVPAPHLYAADLEAAICDVPALLESWIPGRAEWNPQEIHRYLCRAAEALVAIHDVAVPADAPLPDYAPYGDGRGVAPAAFSTRPGLWERVAGVLDAEWPSHRKTFIHRDYHPGNVLWDGTQVTGIVDWATAARGPAGIDLARMRQNLAMHHGAEVADQFAVTYVAAGGDSSARHPFWDLLDAADMVLDMTDPHPPGFAKLEDYVQRVLAECGSR